MNTGPRGQWRQGLPPGFDERVEWRRYAGLTVGLAGRRDLIWLKLYAAADSSGPQSVHVQDLLALRPNDADLTSAAEWVATQDVSPEFQVILKQVVDYVRQETR